ncbi:hypothetical protein [Pasteurella sp. PK-2025]|uniref:hypothetical protein n=1 Tax=Pasteurella sp. PK-2025 TaxID=3413133 RepID=UPI003C7445B0
MFPNDYRKTNPLDPQLLFVGQYSDPESGNYIPSDPIGLQGGERPFGYVNNPLDWVDVLGLAGCRMPKWMTTKKGITDTI